MFSYRWSESSATTDSSDDELMDLEQIMDSDTGMTYTEARIQRVLVTTSLKSANAFFAEF